MLVLDKILLLKRRRKMEEEKSMKWDESLNNQAYVSRKF